MKKGNDEQVSFETAIRDRLGQLLATLGWRSLKMTAFLQTRAVLFVTAVVIHDLWFFRASQTPTLDIFTRCRISMMSNKFLNRQIFIGPHDNRQIRLFCV